MLNSCVKDCCTPTATSTPYGKGHPHKSSPLLLCYLFFVVVVFFFAWGLKFPLCCALSSPFRLGNCDLTAACCATLATLMVAKPCLTELDLSYNTLEDEGVRKLCEAVRNPNCKLQQLM